MTSINATPLEQIEAEIRAFPGQCGFHAVDLESGGTLSHNKDDVLEIASTFKLLPLITAYRRSDAGNLDLSQILTVAKSNHVGGSGLLRELEDDVVTSLHNLLRLMIVMSDNVATVQVNAYAQDLGQQALVTVRNKSGFSVGIRSDVASVEFPGRRPVLIAAITNWPQSDAGEQSLLSEPASLLHGTIARIAVDAFRPGLVRLPYTPYSEVM